MSIEQAVYERLKNDAAVTALVAQRISAVILPQGQQLPALSYSIVSLVPTNAMDGDGGKDSARVQIDSWAATYEQVKALARTVRGAMVPEPSDNFALLLLELDLYEDEPRIYHVVQDFSVWS